ncbi:MAG TPA: FtsQ-type POTRA domain-containing protein [Jatrophihabitans sp.]|jgi:cell division protein FtsQ|nr:FtsQ-type POTRA domain-containing protein [Jatrophihabitans sp.]
MTAATTRVPGARRWPIGAGALLVLLVGVGWLVGFSSVLGVHTVVVSGTRLLSPAQVSSAAAVRPGSPLSRLDTAAIRARVAALPQVRTVTVRTSYPSTVLIQVTERVAVGYRAVADGAGLVDADNVQFRTQSRPPAGLPQLATAVPGRSEEAAAVAAVAGALPPELARRVSLISAASTESVTLRLFDGRLVLWGGTDRGADKARLMTALLRQPGRYYDISDPSSVISRGA